MSGRTEVAMRPPESSHAGEGDCLNCGHAGFLHFAGQRGLCVAAVDGSGSSSDRRCICSGWAGTEAAPPELPDLPRGLRIEAANCREHGYDGLAVVMEAAAARIGELTRERDELRAKLDSMADLPAKLEEASRIWASDRAQLALARPIAEACVRWIETGGLCACCNAGPYDGHASDCPVPAWIAGRL